MSLGIYLHIPFCKQKCLYCDFNSYAGKETLIDKYCEALKKEIVSCETDQPVNTVYFGGGTPTVLREEQLGELLKSVKNHFSLTEDCEITIECNPGTIGKAGLEYLYRAGFNRLSIGLQSTNNEVLQRLGRIHDYQDFLKCFQDAREVGFSNLSIDFMYGLPDQSVQDWKNTLEIAVAIQPEHLSCYGLKIEEGTPFATMNLNLPDEDTMREMYDLCVSILNDAGYHRYEISNFSKPKCESRHNLKYWNYEEFLGLGAGAYGCVGGKRYYNFSGISEYCQAMELKGSAVEEEVALSMEEQMSEFCFLGLRTAEGIDEYEFENRFQRKLSEVFGNVLSKNLKRNTMVCQDGKYAIVPEFLFVSNSILADFV